MPYTPDQICRIDQLAQRNSLGLVYIIAHDPAGPVKIGKSAFLASRLEGLQTGNPNKLYVFAAFIGASRARAMVMEGRIHDALDDARLIGEWFSLTVEEAKKACRANIRWRKAVAEGKAADTPRLKKAGPKGTSLSKAKKHTNHGVLKALYKKRIAEWSRHVPVGPPDRSPYRRAS
ncbi:GIY-YIG nuclease family protein [Mesorhizobium sp. M4A.F.Ca.ET.020.02.1.1]|uniref:GIY-YIG nuclease family protein n=1 Tax=Mesorhizobium sp. M4A.F.Ca.ET.020.02.1.1 TaxID=2496652 RepID=UPI000FD3D23E|nr:GIY-YIG nuclease family protein [Mesorhizobium sp. M4A.F.Ca.ET.020.02.1.1]RVD44885.1 GIY-YIG nuclease family protein [Mesorhizobium sp. M4A.F.Ca.ET.020.02.1.1]